MPANDKKMKGANMLNAVQFFDKRENKAALVAERNEMEGKRKREDEM